MNEHSGDKRPNRRLQPRDWGPKEVLIGVGVALSAFALSLALFTVIVGVSGRSYLVDDGDVFDKARKAVTFADERLAAAARGDTLPGPPEFFADVTSVEIGLGTTILTDVALVAIVGIVTKRSARELAATLRMDRYDVRTIWRPVIAVIAAYGFVAVYAVAVRSIGYGPLIPQSTLPESVARDALALSMAGVVALVVAPLTEEIFFRGFVFGGLLRWGFWPAASLSGALFTLSHLDTGSIIPFFVVGVVMAWLFWWRGTLWDNITFHFLFNFTSFALLVATR
ncbi:MAG: CPBP family intramembrane metalloprotease [Chloroflexi bacterium]|nr:CPBP family intramembrane metalloprotease [Chloroflexota bacterium]